MKTSHKKLFAAAVAALSVISCTKDYGYDINIMHPSAIVTVKPDADNSSFYMQLDDNTILNAVNFKKSPFGTREVRALVNYRKPTAEEMQAGGLYDDANNVYVNWIDSILTKKPVPDLGPEENVATYGNDPVEFFNDWATVVEDGYITLHFQTRWSDGIQHIVNLVTGSDPDDPYKVVFYHNANGDLYGEAGDGIVAFSLMDLPDTGGESVDLTLEWYSFSGEKSAKFKYKSR